jgi:transposase
VEWLTGLNFDHAPAKEAFMLLIEQYKQVRKLVAECTKAIHKLSLTPDYGWRSKLLRSIPGIGIIHAMIIITELGDIKRFKDLDRLCSYVGLVPNVHGSGDKEYVGEMCRRGNIYMREALIEAAWQIIRKDAVMLYCFKHYCKRMTKNKAIIKIARKLLSRIRYVLINHEPYQTEIIRSKPHAKFSEASAARIDDKKKPKLEASVSSIQAG